jgi:hypothetical protein
MRLDARKGDVDWSVFDCERCEALRLVLWVDDESNRYCQAVIPMHVAGDEVATIEHQTRKILICPAVRMVLINPLENVEPADATIEAIARNMAAA